MAFNLTSTMALTHAITGTPPASSSAPKTVSISSMRINQNGSRVASGISTVTTTAAAIDVSALGGGLLGCYAIKNLDGVNNLSILRALAQPAFDTLQPGEMSMGRFDSTVTAPAAQMLAWGTMGTVTAAVVAGGSLTVGAFYYKVTAVNAAGSESATSAEATATTTTGNQTINLTWAAVAGAVSYKVYRSGTTGSYVTPALAGSPTTNSFSDTGVALGAGAPPAPTTSVLMEFLICEA